MDNNEKEVVKLITVTYEDVSRFMKENTLKYRPNQGSVSYPIITRIHRRFQEGHRFSGIKVANGTISDGHHRFIALSLLNENIETVPAGENMTKKEPLEWQEVLLVKTDSDGWAKRIGYAKRYDKDGNVEKL